MTRVGLILLTVSILAAGGVVAGADALLNSGPLRARATDAVERATGHALRIDGGVGVAWSLTPAFAARDVVLLNPPGFSRPGFASVRRIEARVALLPLLSGRVEIRSLAIDGADVLLERDAAGRGNWQRPPGPAVPAPASASAPHVPAPVEIAAVLVTDAQVAWKGGPVASIRSLDVAPAGGPVGGVIAVNGVEWQVNGQSGSMMVTPFPLELKAASGTTTLAVSGQVGGVLELRGSAPDLVVAAAVAGRALPALQDVQVSGQFSQAGPAQMRLTAGGSDLAAVMPGLRLMRLDVTAPGLDQPVQVLAQAALGALPLSAALSLARLPTGAAPVPFQALLGAEAASVSVQGSMPGLSGNGIEAVVSARAPDLQALGLKAGLALPPVRDGALDVRVLPAPGGNGVLLRGLVVSMQQGDVGGDLALGFAPRPSLRGSLVSQRLVLDGWNPAAAPAAVPAVGGPPPAPVAAAAPLISTRPLPFALLRRADADIRFTVAQAQFGGAAYRAIEARLVVEDGTLRLDPAQMVSPGGAVQARLMADANPAPPQMSLMLRAPGLDAGGLAAALGLPEGAAAGSMDVDVDVQAAGADPHAMAASVGGHVGLALVDGEIDNQVLSVLLGNVLHGISLPFDKAGRSRVRCFAARLDSAGGQATVRNLALDTTRLRLDGEGLLDLGAEAMDLHLRPVIRMGGTLGALSGGGVAVPVRLTGPFRAPRAEADKGALQPGRFGIRIGGPSADPCGPALLAARDGRPGAAPTGAP